MLHYDAVMRTTIDLPDDLHQAAKSLAHDRRQTLSEAVAEIMRRGIAGSSVREIVTDPVTGFLVMRGGSYVTSDDVAAMLDDE